MSIDKRQLRFGDALRRLRAEAGYRTGKDFAERIGWQTSKVSRLEKGRTLPADSDVVAWVEAVGADADTAAELRNELAELRLERDRWKSQLRLGHADRQRREAVAEGDASRIVTVEYFLVPGLVQTADYARAVFSLAAEMHESLNDADQAVRERVRRQEVLYDPGKVVEVLIGESALRYPPVPVAVNRAQIDRLITLSGLPNLRLGVIPLDVPLPTITMHGYTILDDTVVVEINHTEVVATDPEDVGLYDQITSALWRIAAEGDAARAVLANVARPR
ncbi:helix-turn-helix domain-containing protein [Labedaea rhizosphaerae]|uniref:Helix-turn-helix protein n=1 Tax=Labedaea rhizosphaerae TaxID=598644 RepID=A0A4R6SQC8_LABRH|nr:helix-turn-helix transcriptional regulator [Labedaea rhizosphaerae]TDQ05810.1 helix-turn-helix protein [Labedaea rhizosphaerae]